MLAQTGVIKKSFSPATAYQHSFGALPEGTTYHGGIIQGNTMIEDLNTKASVGMKALGVIADRAGGAGTAGVAMVPVYVDPRIVDTSRKYTPLVEMFPRVTNIGLTADYNKVTAKGAAVTAAEDAALNEADDTISRATSSVKYVYAIGRVTGQARAAYPSYILEGFQATGSGLAGTAFSPAAAPNAKQLSVILRARALREKEEALIVNGNASTTATEYSGIVTLQSTENKVDKNTTALEYDDLETAYQYAIDDSGRPNFAVCATSVLADLRKIMIDTFNYRPVDMTTTLPFGVSSHLTLETPIGPVPVLFSQELSNSSGSKSIYFLDMNFWEMRVLQDMTYEDLAKTNDSEKFMLKIYEVLICKNTKFNSWIGEIS